MNEDYIERVSCDREYSNSPVQSFARNLSSFINQRIFSWKSIRLRQNYIDTMRNVKLHHYAGHSHEINNDRSRRTDIKIASRKIVTR